MLTVTLHKLLIEQSGTYWYSDTGCKTDVFDKIL